MILMQIGDQHNKMVAFADDITAAGTIVALRKWWDDLLSVGPSYGYFSQPSKSWLIVKEKRLPEARERFDETAVQITVKGERHLGAVIGTDENKKDYMNGKIEEWTREINLLAEIATTYPHSAYSAYMNGYQYKLTYFLRTIPGIEEELKKLDETIRHKLIPAFTGGHIVNDLERMILSLPPRLGGMGFKIFSEEATHLHRDSMSATSELQNQILGTDDDAPILKSRSAIRNERRQRNDDELQSILANSDESTKRMMEAICQKGVSNWLTAIPIRDQWLELTKQEFWDAVKLRYNWPLERIPSFCACGATFNVAHALSCKKGGFVLLRHNEVRDITAKLLSEVCVNVRKEPILGEVGNEDLPRQTNRARETRLDISASTFGLLVKEHFLT